MSSAEKIKKILDSEIFDESLNSRPDSRFIMKSIKETVLLNIDKPGVDPVDLFSWAVSEVFKICFKATVDSLKEESGNSSFGGLQGPSSDLPS